MACVICNHEHDPYDDDTCTSFYIEELEAKFERYREALKFYADPTNWIESDGYWDLLDDGQEGFKRAQDALKEERR